MAEVRPRRKVVEIVRFEKAEEGVYTAGSPDFGVSREEASWEDLGENEGGGRKTYCFIWHLELFFFQFSLLCGEIPCMVFGDSH